ncbi:MAG: ATP-binding protein [Fidelibacterota bacterium]
MAKKKLKNDKQLTIPITVDKSHIVTIGERLYSESIELIRELINNAYDADATKVDVEISESRVAISDDGEGMDLEGLKQYFNIGSPEKLYHPRSPKFKRERIGQFGIGKFASLSAAKGFEVCTQKGNFAAKVIFDKDKWRRSGASWSIPMELIPPDKERGDGTTVILFWLSKRFDLNDVERRIIEGVPLRAPNFSVFLNGYRITPRSLTGHRIPVLEGTKYGLISGEIVIVPQSAASIDDLGIDVKVKGVTIKREFFGMESWGKAVARVKGEIHADFLPVTTDRSGFIEDSEEYRNFSRSMNKVMEEIKNVYARLSKKTENRKVSRALNEAIKRVYKALALNPDYSPFGALPLAEMEADLGEPGFLKKKKEKQKQAELIESEEREEEEGEKAPKEKLEEEVKKAPEDEFVEKIKRKKSPSLKKLTPTAVIKKVKFGKLGVSCCIDHFGVEGPECFTEGTVIFINRDHPLYQRESKKAASHTMYIARLLTQEISLMKSPRNPRQAYERQNKLLKDAFCR